MWFYQASYNYENMMGLSYLHAMCPAIARLYPDDKEARSAAMKRHIGFYNIEPSVGACVTGLGLAMEEQKALGADIDDETIINVKTGLMGPLSGIGDTLMQGVMLPLILAFFIDWAKSGNWIFPVGFFILLTAIVVVVYRVSFMLGYNKGSEAILDMLESGLINKIVSAAGILGCMVMGGMITNFVSMSCAVEIQQAKDSVFNLQESLFDAILPGLLPLLLVLFCYKLLKSGKSSIFVMVVIVVVGTVGKLTGILA